MKFVRVLNPITFIGNLYMPGTCIAGAAAALAGFVEDGDATWYEDPTPPPEPAPDEDPAP